MIELVGWAQHQHYKHRRAPWIKQYAKLLDDPTYRALSHGARSLLNDLWLLGAETDDGCVQLASNALAWRVREASDDIRRWLMEIAGVKDDHGAPRWVIIRNDNDLPGLLASCTQVASKTVLQSRDRVETEKSSVLRTGDEPRPVDLQPVRAEEPDKQLRADRQAAVGRLMGIVRTAAYLGKPPRGYDDARDAQILRTWLTKGRTEAEIADAITGLRSAVENGTVEWVNAETGGLRPGQAFTLRALRNTKNGDRFTWDVALDAAARRPTGPMPTLLADTIRKAVA